MKTKKLIGMLLCLLFITSGGYSQETTDQYNLRKELMKKEESKISIFISENINKEIPDNELKTFYASINNDEHGEDNHVINLSKADKENLLVSFKKNYWRVQYFKLNPSASSVYSPASAAPVCSNGGFESDFASYSGWFAYGNSNGYISGDCSITTSSFTFTSTSLATANVADFDIMTTGSDPIVTSSTLARTYSGSKSARINSSLNDPHTPLSYPNFSVSRLTKNITLSSANQVIKFKYALVMTNPSGHNNKKPTFKARLLKSGSECDAVCITSYVSDPFLLQASTGSNNILYKQWACGELEACGNAGETVTLEFLMTDCGAGGHWGYAYIDDICDTCTTDTCNFQGSINLQPTDTCNRTVKLCGDFKLAAINCNKAIPKEVRIFAYKNGVQVGSGPIKTTTTFTMTSTSTGTFCVTISPSDFPPGSSGGYDFHAEIDYDLGTSGITTANDYNSNPGLNNDYIFNAQCCIATTPSCLRCIYSKDFKQILSWSSVPGTTYEIELIYNDPKCCNTGIPPTAMRYKVSTNFFSGPFGQDCFSWRVRSICPDGTKSAWSRLQCSCTPPKPCEATTPSDLDCKFDKKGQHLNWNLVPNGATYILEITYNDPECCQNGIVSKVKQIKLDSNSYSGPFSSSCFSWRVKSVCPDGKESNWSNKKCSCQPCVPIQPSNLQCTNVKGGQKLEWNAIPGATYAISFSYNDPKCCKQGTPYSTPTIYTSNNYYINNSGGCYKWTVISICPDGSKSTSSSSCSCPAFVATPKKTSSSTGNLEPKDNQKMKSIEITTAPNPTRDLVVFNIKTKGTVTKLGKVAILNLSGKAVFTSQVKMNGATTLDLKGLAAGTYLYKVTYGDTYKSGKLIITD